MRKLLVAAIMTATSLAVVGFAFAGSAGASVRHPTYALGTAKHCKTGYVRLRYHAKSKWECRRVGVAPNPTPPAVPTPPAPGTITTPGPSPTTIPTIVPPTSGSILTETTMAPPITNSVLPPGVCSGAETCFPEDENGALVYTAVTNVTNSATAISPGAGQVTFVFDAPVTATSATIPFQYNQFTLTTTEDGQTSCPVQWVSAHVEVPYDYFQSEPGSVAMDGIPACTVSNVELFDFNTGESNACSVPTGVPGDVPAPYESIADFNDCPSYPAVPSDNGGYLVGAPLNWTVTANYVGEGEYAASASTTQSLVVGPTTT